MDNLNQQTPAPQAPIPEQKNNYNWLRTLAIGFGIVSIGITIALGGYILATKTSQPLIQKIVAQPSPTPDPTANWKIYSSGDYTIRYPSILALDSKDPKELVLFFPEGPESLTPYPSGYAGDANYPSRILIRHSEVVKGTSITEATKIYKAYPSQSIVIDGLNGLYFPSVPGQLSNAYAFILKNNNLYTFNISEGNETSQVGDFSKQRLIFQQIISTFKFTDQNQSINTSNWKKYSDNNYTFMYPPDWIQTGPDQYLDTVQLLNPNKTVSITISKGQYPYGFAGSMETKTNKITIEIDDKTIETTETILNNKGAYVDFPIGDYHILYGTDYPAVGTQASLTDYNIAKETIVKILYTFKFTP